MTQASAPRISHDELEGARWHKSSHSGTDNGCVEHAKLTTGRHAVRDTKDRDGGTLIFDATAWHDFLTAIRNGTL